MREKMVGFSDKKRKFRLDSIQTMKIGDFGFNDFFLREEFIKGVFFPLNLLK